MIVCVLDDLLFSVKISTAAKAVGAAVFFERVPAMVLDSIRNRQPSLVILDLNNAKFNPLGLVTSLKADPTTRNIKTLGFVSHVHTEIIEAARAAGIDTVLARSAFAAQLADILKA